MKIIQLITELRLAGAERVVGLLSRGMIEAGHEVTVVSLMPLPGDEECSIVPELKACGAEVVSLGVAKDAPWRIGRLKNVIRSEKPDIVHSHLIHANLTARLFIPKQCPLVNTVHIAERRSNKRWHFWLDRLTKNRCTIQTAVSKAVRDFHAPLIGCRSQDMPVIYNGIERSLPLPEQKRLDIKMKWELGSLPVIGSVGRLNRQKGYDRLIQTLYDWQGPAIGLLLIGDGSERTALASLAEKLPKNIKPVFTGFRNDASRLAGAFDVFVMPSRYEGFGLTLIEAMSHGLPIVASKADSLPELMKYYDNGSCIDFSNANAVCHELESALSRPRSTGAFPFSSQKMTGEYINLYQNILQK